MKRLTGRLTFLALLLSSQWVSAACWNIVHQDGNIIHATAIWHIQNKLLEQPVGLLLGRVDGRTTQIPVEQIRSMRYRNAASGWNQWLNPGDRSVDLELRNGRRMVLRVQNGLQFRTTPKATGLIPLDQIDRVSRCDGVRAAHLVASAQVPLPGSPVPANSENLPSTLRVRLKNGDVLHGELVSEIRWKSAYGILSVAAKRIRAIRFDAGQSTGALELRSGDRLSGGMTDGNLHIRLSIGQDIQIPITAIESISVVPAAAP